MRLSDDGGVEGIRTRAPRPGRGLKGPPVVVPVDDDVADIRERVPPRPGRRLPRPLVEIPVAENGPPGRVAQEAALTARAVVGVIAVMAAGRAGVRRVHEPPLKVPSLLQGRERADRQKSSEVSDLPVEPVRPAAGS